MAPSFIPSIRLHATPTSSSSSPLHAPSLLTTTTSPPSSTSSSAFSTSTTEQSFTDPTAPMPPPGPPHYEARRALWLTPPRLHMTHTAHATYNGTDTDAGPVTPPSPHPPPHPSSPPPPSPSTSRAKLEALLSQEGITDDDAVWNAGLRNVWKGLVGGGRLRRRLPLAMVIKILKAGWQRDGTWPADCNTGPPSPVMSPLPSFPVAVPPSREVARGDINNR